jgi:ribosome-binding factor A
VRHTPELVFEYDEGLDATDRVAKLLAEIKPAGAGPDDAEGGADDEE